MDIFIGLSNKKAFPEGGLSVLNMAYAISRVDRGKS
jgi:hypothetical protein